MTELERKAAFINELIKVIPLLPNQYLDEVKDLLPEKSKNRIKNACAGLVRDAEVLKALKKIAEKERLRRRKAAQKELQATQAYA